MSMARVRQRARAREKREEVKECCSYAQDNVAEEDDDEFSNFDEQGINGVSSQAGADGSEAVSMKLIMQKWHEFQSLCEKARDVSVAACNRIDQLDTSLRADWKRSQLSPKAVERRSSDKKKSQLTRDAKRLVDADHEATARDNYAEALADIATMPNLTFPNIRIDVQVKFDSGLGVRFDIDMKEISIVCFSVTHIGRLRSSHFGAQQKSHSDKAFLSRCRGEILDAICRQTGFNADSIVFLRELEEIGMALRVERDKVEKVLSDPSKIIEHMR